MMNAKFVTCSTVSIDKAKTRLGFTPRYSNKEALIRNYQWYLENKDSFIYASDVSHRLPWKQGILGLVKVFFNIMLIRSKNGTGPSLDTALKRSGYDYRSVC
jgi:hypothetical protein